MEKLGELPPLRQIHLPLASGFGKPLSFVFKRRGNPQPSLISEKSGLRKVQKLCTRVLNQQ